MSQKITNSLSGLMKKQNSANAGKKNYALKYKAAEDAAKVKNGEKVEEKEQNSKEEELSEEEQLAEAKKASKSKARDIDQTEMIKKLIMQSVVKYTIVIGSLVILTYGIINFAPAVAHALNGLLHEMFVSAITGGK
jgi:hypothetical protein